MTTTCVDKDKQTSSVYDIKGKEKTSSTPKSKKRHGMVMFISMNVVNNSELQPSNERA